MKLRELLDELTGRLSRYRSDFANADDSEVINGSIMIAATVDRLLESLKSNDLQQARLEVLTFSRQVSDACFTHPGTLKDLSETVQKVRNTLK